MYKLEGRVAYLLVRFEKPRLIGYLRFVHAGPFLEIIATLLSSSQCPKPVMSLCAQALLRAFSDPKARGNGGTPPPPLVNLWNTINKGLGLAESMTSHRYFLLLHEISADRLQRTRHSSRPTNPLGEPSPSRPPSYPRSSTQGQTRISRHRRHPPPHTANEIPSPVLVGTQCGREYGKHGPMQAARYARVDRNSLDLVVGRVRSAVDACFFAFDLAKRDRENG